MKKLVQWAFVAIAFSAVTSCVAVVGNTAQPVVNVESTDYGKPSDVIANEGAFKIKTLKYNYDAFSKYVDAKTMYIHFSKHYVGYLNNLKTLLFRNVHKIRFKKYSF